MDFKQPYNPNEFVNFLSTFLPDDFEKTEENIELNDLSFTPDRIKNVKLIGNVSSLENLRIYEIYHESENDPRVTLSRETFRLMSNYGVKKALAAFISGNSQNYRFSLATIDLKLEGARVTREYSNPRRYSFYLGPEAKIHTPEEFLINKGKIKDLKDLQNRFSVEVVTKTFFSELSNWYFWALKNVVFPKDAEKENGRNIAVIRLITRLIFIWFMKQKGLMPDYLFNEHEIKNILKDISPNENTYYKTILQNLFFASLNTPQNERRFRSEKRFYKGFNPDFGDNSIYRYQSYFREPENIIDYFKEIPFLNGGLFECLDRKEENIYIDGFTDIKKNQPIVPNFLFFSKEKEIDLNKDYGTKEKRFKVRGLLDLLQLYNFTIDESTPIDVEIALDPELLGRVFENLLASYNPETATTARKATGSYYTPRTIVDYMVAQSLKEYFKTHLTNVADIDSKIDDILSYDSEENPFSDEETNTLINAVNKLKIIDPAVGSGAFPMGILHKLVLVLSKLDPHNEKWKQQQIKAIEENVTDAVLRKELIAKTEFNFQRNELNYGRKLYIIQNCIYGVDIQPIATQIAKLRFFISLLVDETVEKSQDYDIEPLPNLETKFVTANSLIGLEQQEILRNHNIISLENELRKIRDVYFSTSVTERKEMLRKRDKEIREKLAVLLKEGGFPSENTKKITDWDPYDANRSATWFDPEWMFGVKGGFNIVIGNPPYGFRNILTKEEKEYFRKVEMIVFSSGDSAELFCRKCFDSMIKDSGVLVFIIPKKSLYGDAWEGFRYNYWMKYDLIFLLDASKAFQNVLLEANVFGLAKNNSNVKVKCGFLAKNDEIIEFAKGSKSEIFLENNTAQIYKLLFPRELWNKIQELKINTEIVEGKLGLAIGVDFFSDKVTDYKLLKGIDIGRWKLRSHRWLRNKQKLNWNEAKKFLRPKVIAQRVVAHIENPVPHIKITACYDEEGIIITNTLISFKIKMDIEPKFLLAYLNSTFTSWYVYNFIYSRAIRTMDFYNFYIQQIPIPKSVLDNLSAQQSCITLVDRIHAITKDEDYMDNSVKQAQVIELECKIDRLIYKLYNLTDDEIRIVEGLDR